MSNFIVKNGTISKENGKNKMLGKKRLIVENDFRKTLSNLEKNPEIFKLLNNKENEIISRKIEYKLSHILKGESIINDLIDTGKLSKKETEGFIFNEDLMNSLMYWKTTSSIGKGLNNLGNTCFLNSVLQCLLYTPILENYLRATKHKSICKVKNVCFLCEMEKLLSDTGKNLNYEESSGSTMNNFYGVTPKGIIQNLKLISKNIKRGRQEDAHEFLLYLLDALENSVKQFLFSVNIQNINFIRNEKSYQDNLISQIFGGRLKSSVICHNCKSSSDKYDNYLDLSLDILNTESIEKSFSKFCKPEELAGNNKYFCEKCKARHNSTKKMSFDRFPRVLIIHLKRFDNFGRKVKKYIQYGIDLNLNFLKNNINNNEDVKYKLYAVLVHEGFSTFSGHYYCYVKNSNDIWYCMNDSDVRQVTEKSILNQTPYLLFYERIINDKKKFSIDYHIRQLKNEPILKNLNGNASESTTTTDSDSIEKVEDKVKVLVKEVKETKQNNKENINNKKNLEGLSRANSFSNELLRSNSIISECENVLTKSVSLNFFMNSADIPRFVSKNMKRLLKLKSLQSFSISERKIESSVINKLTPSNENFVKQLPLNIKEVNQPQIIKKLSETTKPTYPSFNASDNNNILKKKISEIYGSQNISLWDDNDNQVLEKQFSFIKKENLDKERDVLKKDQYDIDYDRGKTKKIKKKKVFPKTNLFQKRQDRDKHSRKIINIKKKLTV